MVDGQVTHRDVQTHQLKSTRPPKNTTSRMAFSFVGGHPPNSAANVSCLSSADEAFLVTLQIIAVKLRAIISGVFIGINIQLLILFSRVGQHSRSSATCFRAHPACGVRK
jgi:hypothetical protein